MPELVGFQTMEIVDPNGVTFDAVGVFGLDFYLNLVHHTVMSTHLEAAFLKALLYFCLLKYQTPQCKFCLVEFDPTLSRCLRPTR